MRGLPFQCDANISDASATSMAPCLERRCSRRSPIVEQQLRNAERLHAFSVFTSCRKILGTRQIRFKFSLRLSIRPHHRTYRRLMTELSVDRLRRRWSRRLAISRMADDVLKLSDLRTAGGCIGRRCAQNKYDARNQGCALIPIHVSFLLQGTLPGVHRASTLRRPRLGTKEIKALRGSSIKLGFRKINSNLFGDAACNYNGARTFGCVARPG